MVTGRAAVPRRHRPTSSGWFTAALVVGLNLVAGILIWSVWKGTGVSGLGPAAVFGVTVGTLMFLAGAVRALLDVRAANRDRGGRRAPRRPGRTVRGFEHAHLAGAPVAPVRHSPRSGPVFEPASLEPVGPRRPPAVGALSALATDADVEDVDADDVDAGEPIVPGRPQVAAPGTGSSPIVPSGPEPGVAARSADEPLSLRGLHGLGATMQTRMFDFGLITQGDLAAVGDDEMEDLAAELGTFPGRLAGWVAEARANIAAADPYMRSA